jgi:hypothetical protein
MQRYRAPRHSPYRHNGLAPAVGLEPTTKRLTAARSTTELRRNNMLAHEERERAHGSIGRRKYEAQNGLRLQEVLQLLAPRGMS